MRFLVYSIILISIVLVSISGLCQSPDREIIQPEISSPAIQKIIDVRTSRLPMLTKLKAREYIGENKDAELQIINIRTIPDDQKYEIEQLVESENMDRKKMFLLIAKEKGWALSQLQSIKGTYALAIRNMAVKGDWIQKENGLWERKE